MTTPENLPKYRWPNLSSVKRRYLVRDDQGRIGIATYDPIYHPDILWARPVGAARLTAADVPAALPNNAIIITDTSFKRRADGKFSGIWYDYDYKGFVRPEDLRILEIVEDLGWVFDDEWADRILAGSDQDGHWDYGATIAYIPPKRPVKGQKANEMTVKQAVEYAREVGETVTARGLRKAARSGYIPGARKIGRDWLIPYEGLNHYLDHRPRPGRRPIKSN